MGCCAGFHIQFGRRYSSGNVPRKLSQNLFQRGEARRVDEAKQAHFQVQAGIRLAAEIVLGKQQNLEEAR